MMRIVLILFGGEGDGGGMEHCGARKQRAGQQRETD